MEWIVGLISAIAALIGAVWGIVKYYDSKSAKEQEKREELEAERHAALEDREAHRDHILEDIAETLVILSEDNQHQKEEITSLQSRLSSMHEQIESITAKQDGIQESIEENEMDRLRSEIINCVNKLRNGFEMSQVDLEHIHHCYDKYRARGGNSYIKACMEYVFEYERECREAGVIGFENSDK